MPTAAFKEWEHFRGKKVRRGPESAEDLWRKIEEREFRMTNDECLKNVE